MNNSIRQRFELPKQALSASLTKAAQNQAEFMARTHRFSHYSNDSPGVRAGKFGYDGTVTENIARSYYSVEETFYAWVDSPEHWRAIANPNIEVGFGYSIAKDGTTYWVALYGTPVWSKNTQPLRVLVNPSNFRLVP